MSEWQDYRTWSAAMSSSSGILAAAALTLSHAQRTST